MFEHLTSRAAASERAFISTANSPNHSHLCHALVFYLRMAGFLNIQHEWQVFGGFRIDVFLYRNYTQIQQNSEM